MSGDEEDIVVIQDAIKTFNALKEKYLEARFVLTLGSKGAYYLDQEQKVFQEAFKVNAVDTTAAGDAFWGGFLYQLSKSGKHPQEISLDEAKEFARFGNAVASLCVEKRGGIPAIPEIGQVLKRLDCGI